MSWRLLLFARRVKKGNDAGTKEGWAFDCERDGKQLVSNHAKLPPSELKRLIVNLMHTSSAHHRLGMLLYCPYMRVLNTC